MTDINGFMWDSIYKESIKAGASEQSARAQASIGTQKFKNGQFKKTSQLVKDCIKEACKQKRKKESKEFKTKAVINQPVPQKLNSELYRLKQAAKALPEATQSTSGSKDGLWSTNIRSKS